MNSNYWGIICIPIGLIICFAPPLIATIFTTPRKDENEPAKKD